MIVRRDDGEGWRALGGHGGTASAAGAGCGLTTRPRCTGTRIIGSQLWSCYRAMVQPLRKNPGVLTRNTFGVLRACPRFARGLHCDSPWRKCSPMQKLPQKMERESLAGARCAGSRARPLEVFGAL
jgi:hypothetical protein